MFWNKLYHIYAPKRYMLKSCWISALGLALLIPHFASAEVSLADALPPNRVYGALDFFENNTHLQSTEGISTRKLAAWREQFGYQYAKRDTIYFYARETWGGGKGTEVVNNQKRRLVSYPSYLEGRVGYQFGIGKTRQFGITPYTGYFLLGQTTYIADPTKPGRVETALLQNVIAGTMIDYIVNESFRLSILLDALISVKGNTTTGRTNTITQERVIRNRVNYLSELWITWQMNCRWDLTLVPSYVWIIAREGSGATASVARESNPGIRLELGYRF